MRMIPILYQEFRLLYASLKWSYSVDGHEVVAMYYPYTNLYGCHLYLDI